MLPHASLSGIRIFEAVARRGSFKAAAAELNLTPSAVSHAIATLERALGVTLFEREGRPIRLTGSGELLVRHVSAAFSELRRGFESVAAQRGRGILHVHSAPSFAYAWLSPRLPRFIAEHPGLEVRLAAGTDYARFGSDDVDCDIVYGPVRATGVLSVPIAEETVTPICAPALAATIAGPADILAHNLIVSGNKQVRWPHWLEKNGLAYPGSHSLRFDRSFLAIGAAADGLGVALESTLLAARELESGRVVAPLLGRSRSIRYAGHHLVYSRDSERRPIVRLFIDWIEREMAAGSAPGAPES
jgi:LysR family glycine cleavage system transcriptional activator